MTDEELKALRKRDQEIVNKMNEKNCQKYAGRNLTGTDNESPVPSGMANCSAEEKFPYYEKAAPGCYLLVEGKIISKTWALNHIDKFKVLYPNWVNEHPSEFADLYQQTQAIPEDSQSK